jgi:hypothetical protein
VQDTLRVFGQQSPLAGQQSLAEQKVVVVEVVVLVDVDAIRQSWVQLPISTSLKPHMSLQIPIEAGPLSFLQATSQLLTVVVELIDVLVELVLEIDVLVELVLEIDVLVELVLEVDVDVVTQRQFTQVSGETQPTAGRSHSSPASNRPLPQAAHGTLSLLQHIPEPPP